VNIAAMASVSPTTANLSVTAHRGDAKTLLAFNLAKKQAKNLAGFTIQCRPGTLAPYYIFNELQFKTPGDHAQDPTEPPYSSVNAPIHKFRWLHVPGSSHQGTKPFFGTYRYSVTPRYFDGKQSLQPLDASLTASLDVEVAPFVKQGLAVGFTRGFTQSQAFVRHFGLTALIRPKGSELLFDTSAASGQSATGERYTYRDEYDWLGFTARERIFDVLNEVLADKASRLDMFAYDLNEPDLMALVIELAGRGQARVILDNAALHHDAKGSKPEDQFEKLFTAAAARQPPSGQSAIKRGKFGRYAHDKVLIVSKASTPVKVVTGSTNFSVTGLYVNSNHVLVFDDPTVAGKYAAVFQEAWDDNVSAPAFRQSPLAAGPFTFESASTPAVDISFAPHQEPVAAKILGDLVARVAKEGHTGKRVGSVLFAVMQFDSPTAKTPNPVYTALRNLHTDQSIFSYGITDSQDGIVLYRPKSKQGVLVTGKPASSQLPPPFNQVPNLGSFGHQVHHKFVVCGFNGPDPVVYCGSSNLASGGEVDNGDNLLAIRDSDVATAFAIEALALVDHFDFLDRSATAAGAKTAKPAAIKRQAAVSAGWFLSTTDAWTAPYFDRQDLRSVDRQLFA
jgi:phosphatidylserine/phosphatidylglycerophosphate/cardiolipin synthase-like enzyme